MKYNTYTLDNGLRIIHLPSDSKVVYCGYQINAGTRNEEPGEEGLAHFCEHVTFKGTERRKAWHILNCLESVGGDLNAYTNKEGTVYYSAILKEHIARAVDLLTDIVFHSVYPQAEIDKEVEVICDEIESYNDSPAELIYDEFENIIFKGSQLGHNILGTAEQVRSFKTEDALRFTRKLYRPDNSTKPGCSPAVQSSSVIRSSALGRSMGTPRCGSAVCISHCWRSICRVSRTVPPTSGSSTRSAAPSAAQNGFHPPLCIPDSSFAGVTERMAPPPADYTKNAGCAEKSYENKIHPLCIKDETSE